MRSNKVTVQNSFISGTANNGIEVQEGYNFSILKNNIITNCANIGNTPFQVSNPAYNLNRNQKRDYDQDYDYD